MDEQKFIDAFKRGLNNLIVQAIILTVCVVIFAAFMFNFLEYILGHHLPPDGSPITIDDAFYWAVITITTVGYGDITPSNFITRVFGMIIAVYGSGVMMMTSGLVASHFIQRKFEKQAAESGKGSGSIREFTQLKDIRQLGLIGLTIGKALLKLKEERNQILIGFVRGDKIIINPPATEKLESKDKLLVF
ncbi:MAG: potassium channel family protein, partial [Candidatus Helarchaeota archaeon]